MKTNIITRRVVSCFILLSTLFISSCEDFLDRPQLNNPDDQSFWTQENNIRLFANEFYPQFFVGYNSSWTLDYSHFKGYMFSDDVVSKNVQSLFETSVPPSRGSSSNTTSAPAWMAQYAGPTWYFGWIRKANMMLNRLDTRMKGTLSTESMNHWTAVARFFKALDYCRLVSVFGDVPYFEAEFSTGDKDIMYKDRTPRNEVMDKVYDDFKYAIQNLRENDGNQCLNKNIAAGFISRWMLFEGTWQKYQNNDNTRAKKFLDFAVEASEIIMNSGKYEIATDMHTLFGSDNLAGNKECILYRHYDATQSVTHCIASYNCSYEAQDQSANLDVVKAFICKDGKDWQNSTVENADKFDLANLIKTRDPRFEASFLDKLNVSAAALLFTSKFVDRTGPKLTAPIPAKYYSNTNTNDAPVIRLGEILLNWIEAKAELSTLGETAVTQADIDKSINILRKRPLDEEAINKGVVKSALMSLAALPNDPSRDADVPQLIWEIRRERRMELFMEPSRLLDLKRWKKINYMKGSVKPDILKGIWVDLSKEMPSLLTTAKKGITQVMKADGSIVKFNGSNAADMVGFYLPEGVKDRDDFTDRVYLSPVGKSQIDLYISQGYKLTQTKGWE
ncbi:MAG TPA: RagB/SusD family nutrient uptake outer membrane protein [Bacteroides graminisolvens]|uniref:RagB/SusD family nutrient uptake outer membrane protein n=1 Tax=Bacteroides graminisolvens TaxID=477666 RepID=A0A3D2SD17_9BACE|nr:RagB/SusD family nutrient uptake outer membrane protein [Bacteroides graminisolvens]